MGDKYAVYGANLLKEFTPKNLETLFQTQKFLKKLLASVGAAGTPFAGVPFLFQMVDNQERMRLLCRFLGDHITRQKILSDCLGVDTLGYFNDIDGASTLMCFMRDTEGASAIRNLVLRNPALLDCFTTQNMNTICTHYGKGSLIPKAGTAHIPTDLGPTTLAFCVANATHGAELIEGFLNTPNATLHGPTLGNLTCGNTRSMLFHYAWNKSYRALYSILEKQPKVLTEFDSLQWVATIIDPMEFIVRPIRTGWCTLYVFFRQKDTEGVEVLRKYAKHLFEANSVVTEKVLLRQVEDLEQQPPDPKNPYPPASSRKYYSTCLLVEMQRCKAGQEATTELLKNNPDLLKEVAFSLKHKLIHNTQVSPKSAKKGDPDALIKVALVPYMETQLRALMEPELFESLFSLVSNTTAEEADTWHKERHPQEVAEVVTPKPEEAVVVEVDADKKKKKKRKKKKKKAAGTPADDEAGEEGDAEEGEEEEK